MAAERPPLEMWAGFECTLNRVGDNQYDQLALQGHYQRHDDLSRLAELGVKTVRYPILWERMAGETSDSPLWQGVDARMNEMQALGIEPVIGLVHHGSGPFGSSLLDSSFASGLAAFARTVSERYPWVTMYTPVNEPLTTARFSALYGVWYPHATSDVQFLRATLNQINAIRLAMEEIRKVAPGALLVQTEDIGQTHATPLLSYQADFENHRRWLTFDLLCGHVVPGHPMYEYAAWLGVACGEIDCAVGLGCVPDIIGVNYYATSERWLDERVHRFPSHTHGGNARHTYADVEALRVSDGAVTGFREILGETWNRYRRPIVASEVHLGCTREQQLRWLRDAWSACEHARHDGADIRAAVAWAAFGACDWSSLVTRFDGDYEAGLFDIRSPVPRQTALASFVRACASGERHDHPVLGDDGWWKTKGRLTYHEAAEPWESANGAEVDAALCGRPILITGAAGTLGTAFTKICHDRGLAAVAMDRTALDICDRRAVELAIASLNPWAVVNAAGFVRVDDAEHHAQQCRRENVTGPTALAKSCAKYGVSLLSFSSDLVFGGIKGAPYTESDSIHPLCVYGASKAESERAILSALPGALIARTAAFFGPWDEWNFITRVLQSLENGIPIDAAGDLTVSPTYVPDLVNTSLDLLIDGERGVWHLANDGAMTWADFAVAAARASGLDETLIRRCGHRDFGFAAQRPLNSALASERGLLMPSLQSALSRYTAQRAQFSASLSHR